MLLQPSSPLGCLLHRLFDLTDHPWDVCPGWKTTVGCAALGWQNSCRSPPLIYTGVMFME